ncbi:hypothetical protein F3Y22_tig00111614pilonHSYRG00134 [Hibiscus syriacus]|uniref:NB-ARC domain-containing protein n=1 Tax=Hibiscus syriacus TaxID=106335 RepID=A0A6A2YIL0_HIBSY|nr:hypothetical protein F3Y22_tig00111614pilonHSYRG00134 [Hibiscus syriacus]
MEAVISSIGGKAGELAFDVIKHEVTYVLNYKTNLDNLKEGVEDLRDVRHRLQQSVDAARRQGRKIYQDVDKWLNTVDHKISEMAESKLKEDEERANERRFVGLCPDFKNVTGSARKLGRRQAPLLNSWRKADLIHFLSPCSTKSRMATLADDIARFAEGKLFDNVVVSNVSQTPTIEKIQTEIAAKFGLGFDDPCLDSDEKRIRLHRRLQQTKVLVILDDILVPLELEALGIPSRGENMGCKILLTSRKCDVLLSMGVPKPFAINKEEACDLFTNITQRYNLHFEDYQGFECFARAQMGLHKKLQKEPR